MTSSRTTTDHQTIRNWVTERGGRPATVRGTESGGEPGVLRIDFEEPDESLEIISWDDFLTKFDESNLAFLYQEKTAEGQTSRFCKFVDRDAST